MKTTTIAVLSFVFMSACVTGGADDETSTIEQGLTVASPASARPAPADYDGDGATDMALKGANGYWYIDYAANGLGGPWDWAFQGYGGSTAVPVPADYDGDEKADLAVKDAAGMWGIDYAWNGFGAWDLQLWGYGDSAAVPVPADYDGDGKADLSVKTSTGDWFINYSADGFTSGWNAVFGGYGDAAAIPVPGDYDGDLRADLAIKDHAGGCWFIDFWSNGFGGWNEIRCGYGNSTAIPIPYDYDRDGRTDLSVKGPDGRWYIDHAAGGFGAWNAIYTDRGDSTAIGVPGDYNGDGVTDFAVDYITNGNWYIDYGPSYAPYWEHVVNNPARPIVDSSKPYIVSTTIIDENGPVSLMTVGRRYVVDVAVHPGYGVNPPGCEAIYAGCPRAGGVEVNPGLNVPESLKIVARTGTTYVTDMGKDSQGNPNPGPYTHRRFPITCSEPGNFPLGFQVRTAPYGGPVANADFGIRAICVPPSRAGVSGRVTRRVRNPVTRVFESSSDGIADAHVTIANVTAHTDASGYWHLPAIGRAAEMRVSKPGFSDTVVVNLDVPPSGMQVDTPLEQSFPRLPIGVTYTTYIDYSRGRTLMHVVKVNPSSTVVRSGRTDSWLGECYKECTDHGHVSCPAFIPLHEMGDQLRSLVITNSTWWNVCSGNTVGYGYSRGYLPSEVWCDPGLYSGCNNSNRYFAEEDGTDLYPGGTTPMLTIAGTSPGQHFAIAESRADFWEIPSQQWSIIGSPGNYQPIWDVSPRDGVSDIDYAVQIPNPPLLRDGKVIKSGDWVMDAAGHYDHAFARTSVGIDEDTGAFHVVIVDGEGIWGAGGSTANTLAHFYRDVLGADIAMGTDSGLSTEMNIRTASGLHRVNTIAGEDATFDVNPYEQVAVEIPGNVGSVGYYLSIGP